MDEITITVTICNWEKYNPKRDQKTYTWLRLDNSFITDPKLFGMDAEQKLIWIAILCEASKKNNGEMQLNLAWLSHNTKVSPRKIEDTLLFLIERGIISSNDTFTTADYRILPPTTPTNVRTNERTYMLTESLKKPVRFDFEALYQKYPRKKGKLAGIKKCKSEIRTTDDYAALSASIDRFLAFHKENRTDPQFIPYFSSFMTNWKECLDPDWGTATDFKKDPPKEYFVFDLTAPPKQKVEVK